MIIGDLNLKKIGDRLRKVDRFILDVLGIRLANGGLSDYVAENKRKSSADGVFNKRRQSVEDERIGNMKKWAIENGIDPNFAASLMYQLISESCRVQDEIMVNKFKNNKDTINEANSEEVYNYQKQNLLNLTSKIAPLYDENYAKDFFGTKIYNEFEKKILYGLIADISNKTLAVDFGCATGIMSFEIASQFEKVIGYDISSSMISVANKKITDCFSNVEFVNIDIEKGIDLSNNSVSLAIMNMGTASDVKNIKVVLKYLKHSLSPKGKFLFSFYSSESLLAKLGFLPWPMQLAAHIDLKKRCLEVRYNNDVFSLYARARNVEEVKNLFIDFEIDGIYTFPTLASVLPNIILGDENKDGDCHENVEAKKLIKKIDISLANSDLHSGTYIIVTGGKIA